MRVAFLYNRSSEDPAGLAEDEVPARSPVVAALRRLGHRVVPIACTLNLARVRRRIVAAQPDVVFNRVESLGGSDAMMAAIPMLLETMRLPYTGCPAGAMIATADKLGVKRRLRRAGLPTPAWISDEPAELRIDQDRRSNGAERAAAGRKYIVKSTLEHASFQIQDDSVIKSADFESILSMLRRRSKQFDRPFFAEEFIDGREFNLSLLGARAPVVLPAAEIDFSQFPDDKPHIVGYSAKWDCRSFEFHHTPRCFDTADRRLWERLKRCAIRCWDTFELRGYVRIDFRVDRAGKPWILEINTNPAISPDAGFAATMQQAGLDYEQMIARILDLALEGQRSRKPGAQGAGFGSVNPCR